ncbi:MAG: hypothetical protein LC808_05285, partial [Actinobacteria bacterium]|nr:hypothetical protein [Actinomycetota bacterium]
MKTFDPDQTILEPELRLSLGDLTEGVAARLEARAIDSLPRSQLLTSQELRLRGLQWLALGNMMPCSSRDMIAVLALKDLTADRLDALELDVDSAVRLT